MASPGTPRGGEALSKVDIPPGELLAGVECENNRDADIPVMSQTQVCLFGRNKQSRLGLCGVRDVVPPQPRRAPGTRRARLLGSGHGPLPSTSTSCSADRGSRLSHTEGSGEPDDVLTPSTLSEVAGCLPGPPPGARQPCAVPTGGPTVPTLCPWQPEKPRLRVRSHPVKGAQEPAGRPHCRALENIRADSFTLRSVAHTSLPVTSVVPSRFTQEASS